MRPKPLPSKDPGAIEEALLSLLYFIRYGKEYPDAHTKAALLWNVDPDLLQQRYDEYCSNTSKKGS
jgi:hypothetical protein